MTAPLTAIDELAAELRSRRCPDRPLVVFISGIDGSGKTHFTADLSAALGGDVCVVHVDDFHHPRAHRYVGGRDLPDRYYTRSFDWPLLRAAVLAPLRRDRALDVTLDLLDVDTDAYTRRVHYIASPGTIVLVEGVFLARPEVAGLHDVFVQLEVPLAIAFARAIARDSASPHSEVSDKLASKYFPAQLRYQRDHDPVGRATFVVDNSTAGAPRLARRALALSSLPLDHRRYDAVCFDLWNTLVELPDNIKQRALEATIKIIGGDAAHVRARWKDSRVQRESMPLLAFVVEFCRELGARDPAATAERVCQMRRTIHGEAMRLVHPGAEVAVRMLRAAGLRVGLVSNSTSDVPDMLATTPLAGLFDAEVFSFRTGRLKPDPEVFALASRALDVPPDRIVYVGDGNDDELEGARAAGMIPVLLETAEPRTWSGLRVTTLDDIIEPMLSRREIPT